MNTKEVKYLVVHCTATNPQTSVQSILNYWKNNLGWKNPGYHFLVDANGKIHHLQDIDRPSNGVRGQNHHSIHFSYIGGIDSDGKPKDTRTGVQKDALRALLRTFSAMCPNAIIQGHRDFPGVNKACPSFDATAEYKFLGA